MNTRLPSLFGRCHWQHRSYRRAGVPCPCWADLGYIDEDGGADPPSGVALHLTNGLKIPIDVQYAGQDRQGIRHWTADFPEAMPVVHVDHAIVEKLPPRTEIHIQFPMRRVITMNTRDSLRNLIDGFRDAARAAVAAITNRRPCTDTACAAMDHPRRGHGAHGCLCAVYADDGAPNGWCPCTQVYA